MTNKEAIEFIKTDISRLWDTPQNLEHKEALEKAIKALEQEPCEDVISRQAAIDTCLNIFFNGYKEKDLLHDIKKLPSVTPQPKTGHWVELPTHESQSGLPWYECSECNSERCIAVLRDFKYCPNCGAKMAESEE